MQVESNGETAAQFSDYKLRQQFEWCLGKDDELMSRSIV